MTSKERVRAAVCRKPYDRIPCDFSANGSTYEKLMKHYGLTTSEAVQEKLGSDFRYIGPAYTGPPLEDYIDADGLRVEQTYFGYKQKYHWTGAEYYPMNVDFPWNFAATADEIKKLPWLNADMFNYETVKSACAKFAGKAITIGGAGVYQYSTFLREPGLLYMDMAEEPELARSVFDRFVDFELEHYERILIAADGQVDVLVCNDDYGTQISMLFSLPMWRSFFKENTKKLADLAHRYGAFYMQHSCGAVRPIIPELIACGVDMLDPIQKVEGLEPEGLKRDFGNQLTFHGGIDTQWLLPQGTPAQVREEAARFIRVLGEGGGYILAPSQGFQSDTPIENIEALYQARFD